MNFKTIFKKNKKILSFEFFPPKQDSDLDYTQRLIQKLSKLQPDFMTVTYGAGGGTRANTEMLTDYIANTIGIPSVAHLTCVGHERLEIDQVLDGLKAKGISRILALRGDPPPGKEFQPTTNGFTCARELVEHIRQRGDFSLAVAGYPETHQSALSPKADIEYLKTKVDAGADLIITQLFFDANFYFDFVERCLSAGISVPILPGIMPIANVEQVQRFTGMCGATIPPAILKKLKELESNPDAVKAYGTDLAQNLSELLLENGAPGIHYYTLNKSKQIVQICDAIGAKYKELNFNACTK